MNKFANACLLWGRTWFWVCCVSVWIAACEDPEIEKKENDTDEEEQTDATPGDILVKTTDESAGVNCGYAGVKVEFGKDANTNKALDEAEVLGTFVLCYDADQAAGVRHKKILVMITPETAGENCQEGGEKVLVGWDMNGNGILDGSEARRQMFLCDNEKYTGKPFLTIISDMSTADAQTLIDRHLGPNAIEVSFSNTINITSLSFSGLTKATRIRIVQNERLKTVTFPDLEQVEEYINATANPAASFNFPRLGSAGAITLTNVAALDLSTLETTESVKLYGTESLTELSLPALKDGSVFIDSDYVGSVVLDKLSTGGVSILAPVADINLEAFQTGNVTIRSTALQSLDVPTWQEGTFMLIDGQPEKLVFPAWQTGELHVANSNLKEFSAPQLTTLTGMLNYFTNCSALETISLPSLENVTTDFTLSGLPSLSTLELPKLREVKTLEIAETDLTTIDLPALHSLGGLTSRNNERLSKIVLDALKTMPCDYCAFYVESYVASSEQFSYLLEVLAKLNPPLSDQTFSFAIPLEAESVNLTEAGKQALSVLESNGNAVSFTKFITRP